MKGFEGNSCFIYINFQLKFVKNIGGYKEIIGVVIKYVESLCLEVLLLDDSP